MFDGVPVEQLYQFITSSTRPSSLPLPLPLPFSSSTLNHHYHHHASNTSMFPTFDPYTSSLPPSQQVLQLPHHHFLHPLHHHHQYSPTTKHHQEKQDDNNNSSGTLVAMNFEIERDRSTTEPVETDAAWSDEEVLALLRIRSSFENWFPEFTWEDVSRKLAEVGYKRSAEKCKAKFEEGSRSFNSINNYNKSYRLLNEFGEVYHGHHQTLQVVAQDNNKTIDKPREEQREEYDEMERDIADEDSKKEEISIGDPTEDTETLVEKSKCKKRKRKKKFEMFKGFCEDIVKKMMAQQEEMINKLLEDMGKRDEEKLAREEAWKKQETDRINKELEIRAYEQVISAGRQSTIIKFLKGFTSSDETQCFDEVLNTLNSSTSSSLNLAPKPNSPQNNLEMPTSASHQVSGLPPNQSSRVASASVPPQPLAPEDPSLNLAPTRNPNSPKTQNKQNPPTPSFSKQNAAQNHGSASDNEDLGKRWPRDEVFALINLRCSVYNNGDDKEGTAAAAAKTPLWERISQGMLELGYKRSAKRCKEKWENINKYFRKTKDKNKKRSLDSRTCPYFHQLSHLYNKGKLIAPSNATENRSTALPENHHASSSQGGSSIDSIVHQDEKFLVHAEPPAAFDFDF